MALMNRRRKSRRQKNSRLEHRRPVPALVRNLSLSLSRKSLRPSRSSLRRKNLHQNRSSLRLSRRSLSRKSLRPSRKSLRRKSLRPSQKSLRLSQSLRIQVTMIKSSRGSSDTARRWIAALRMNGCGAGDRAYTPAAPPSARGSCAASSVPSGCSTAAPAWPMRSE